MRLAVITAALALGLVAPVGLATPAQAHFSAGTYTYRNGGPCTAGNRVDPVTVVFYSSATGARSLNHVQFHGGWTHTSGTAQYFLSHGACQPMNGQRADGGTFSSRYHIRARTTYHSDPTWGITAMGSPHYDNLTWCGHAVPPNGFNNGRAEIVRIMDPSPHHTLAGYVNWGNTQSMRQCNGDMAASNGLVAWLSVPSWNH